MEFWSFIFGVIGVIGTIFTIVGLFRKRKKQLKMTVVSFTDVFEQKEEVEKIKILYNGIDLFDSGESLKVATVKIENNGQLDILPTHFLENNPLSLEITNSEVLQQPEIIEASDKHSEHGEFVFRDVNEKSIIRFKNFLLDSKEYFIVRLVFKHRKTEIPEIRVLGKLSGIKKIPVEKTSQRKLRRYKLNYPFIASLLLNAFVLLYLADRAYRYYDIYYSRSYRQVTQKKEERKMILNKFMPAGRSNTTHVRAFLDRTYLYEGSNTFHRTLIMMRNKDDLDKFYGTIIQPLRSRPLYFHLADSTELYIGEARFQSPYERAILEALENGLITIEDSTKLKPDAEFLKKLEEFNIYLNYQ